MTFRAFDFECEQRLHIIEILENIPSEALKEEDEIQRCIIKDSMWLEFGIEHEDYNLAIDTHKLVDNEYVLKRTEEIEQKIGKELLARLIDQTLFQNPQDDNLTQNEEFVTGEDYGDAASQSFKDLFMGKDEDEPQLLTEEDQITQSLLDN